MGPPTSLNTLLVEFVRVLKFPIWNETVALGDPEAPVMPAERLVVEDGQNQSELAPVQLGSKPA